METYDTLAAIRKKINASEKSQRIAGEKAKADFETYAATHASNIIDIIKKGGYGPINRDEEQIFEYLYKNIYTLSTQAKKADDMNIILGRQTASADYYISEVNDKRFVLAHEIQDERNRAIEDIEDLNTENDETTEIIGRYLIERYVKRVVDHLNDYCGDTEALRQHKAWIDQKTSDSDTGADDGTNKITANMVSKVEIIHSTTIDKLFGIEWEEIEWEE